VRGIKGPTGDVVLKAEDTKGLLAVSYYGSWVLMDEERETEPIVFDQKVFIDEAGNSVPRSSFLYRFALRIGDKTSSDTTGLLIRNCR